MPLLDVEAQAWVLTNNVSAADSVSENFPVFHLSTLCTTVNEIKMENIALTLRSIACILSGMLNGSASLSQSGNYFRVNEQSKSCLKNIYQHYLQLLKWGSTNNTSLLFNISSNLNDLNDPIKLQLELSESTLCQICWRAAESLTTQMMSQIFSAISSSILKNTEDDIFIANILFDAAWNSVLPPSNVNEKSVKSSSNSAPSFDLLGIGIGNVGECKVWDLFISLSSRFTNVAMVYSGLNRILLKQRNRPSSTDVQFFVALLVSCLVQDSVNSTKNRHATNILLSWYLSKETIINSKNDEKTFISSEKNKIMVAAVLWLKANGRKLLKESSNFQNQIAMLSDVLSGTIDVVIDANVIQELLKLPTLLD